MLLIWVLIMGLMGLSVVHTDAWAENGSIQMEAEIGYDGDYAGAWAPVLISLSNGENRERHGTLELYVHRHFAQNPVVVRSQLTLPPESSTRLSWTILGDQLSTARLVWREENGDTQELALLAHVVDPHPLQAGVLSSQQFGWEQRLGTILGNSNLRKIYFVQPEHLQLGPATLHFFDLLVIGDMYPGQLQEIHLQSLKGWVTAGGTLLINGGRLDEEELSALEDLLPQETGHLLARRQLGRGQVVLTTYDLANPLLDRGQEVLQRSWSEVLQGLDSGISPVMDERFSPSALVHASNLIPSLSLPGAGMISLLFILYVLIVGPVLYQVLRRRHKAEWAWWLVPLIAVVFTAGIVGYGTWVRGDGYVFHQVAVWELNGETGAQVTGAYAVVASSSADEIGVASNENVAVWPLVDSGSTAVWLPERKQVQYQDFKQWSIQNGRFTTWMEDVGRITAELTLEEGMVRGQVVNQTSYDLADVVVAVPGGGYMVLGDMARGESRAVSLAVTDAGEEKYVDWYGIYTGSNERIHRQQMMISDLPYLWNWERTQKGQEALVLGWTEVALPAFDVLDVQEKAEALNLVVTRISLKEENP